MGRLPSFAKGELRACAKCGFWFPERDPRILKQEGRWVCKWCYDSVTDKQRTEQLSRALNKINR